MRYFLLLLIASLAYSEEPPPYDLNITKHTIQLKTGPLAYTAITGLCPIFGETEKEAELFFISYTKDGEKNRPITFFFPGGPGGAGTIGSILSFGPRRLLSADEGRTILPPYELIDNQETLLEHTDLVFVDPVDCGFSKAEEKADMDYFFSVEGDIETLGDFIYSYIDLSRRWNSPIYLAGGSYGTLRCCGLASHLFEYGMAVSGIALDGCAFEWSTFLSERDNPLPDWLLIPTFAATAWYHGRLWPDKSLEDVVDYARRFLYDELAPFMLQPSRLSPIEQARLEQKLSDLIGLPVDTVRRYNCRFNERIYASEFFGSERKSLGRLDSRYAGDLFTIDPKHSNDPSYLDSIGYGPAFKHYLQEELGTRHPFKKYRLFSDQAFNKWQFGTFDSFGAPSLLKRLRQALVVNPLMKVFVGAGYYDCRTPFAATEFCFEHLDLPVSYRKNIQFGYYAAGHGFVFDQNALKKWKKDLVKFYAP